MTRHLLVIGAQRSGSTYLWSLLDRHPQVTMARPVRPEPKVFLDDEVVRRGRDWYVATWFPHATTEEVLGEKSTSYIEHPQAADRARRVLGDDVQAVAILRDPLQRAVSNWAFSADNGLEQRPLAQALTENLEGERAWDVGTTSVSPYAYLERGRYVDFLEPWWEALGDRLSVVFLAELLASPDVATDLYRRLGVDAAAVQPDTDPVNASREPAPDLPAELRERLRDYFGDSDRRLARRLGRPLPWAQDEERVHEHG